MKARFVAFLFILIGLPAGLWVVAAQSPAHVVIVHTNDIHGQLLPRNGAGGMAEIATIIRGERPDLILDAGDLFTGTFISDEFKGAPTIQSMNKIGYAAGTIGNHEFDYGQSALRIGRGLHRVDVVMHCAHVVRIAPDHRLQHTHNLLGVLLRRGPGFSMGGRPLAGGAPCTALACSARASRSPKLRSHLGRASSD